MAASRKKNVAQAYCLPQLIRVFLRGLDVKRVGAAPSKKLLAEISHGISMTLLTPSERRNLIRAKVEVRLDGRWVDATTEKAVITFLGDYEARYEFPENVSLDSAKEWMDDEYFKDVLVSQSIPVINLHMFSQLEMMGLNPNQKMIGYEVDSEKWNKLPVDKPVSSGKKRRKLAKA